MSEAFENIRGGLNEAIGHAKCDQAGVKVWRPAAVDVAVLRGRLGFNTGAVRGAVRRFGGDPAALGAR